MIINFELDYSPYPLELAEDDYENMFYVTYNAKSNIFYDEGDYINYNIHSIMTPNEIYLFKLQKRDILVLTKSKDLYCIYYDEGEVE